MKLEDIKVGETYNVRVKITSKDKHSLWVRSFGPNGKCCLENETLFEEEEIDAFTPISDSQSSIVNSQSKHDPCRLFRKGDIVEMDTHGRDIAASMKLSCVALGKRYTVTEDENNTGYVSFIGDNGIECYSMFFWLKLVTPVEELEPYYVGVYSDQDDTCYDVANSDGYTVVRFFDDLHPHAKEAAEAECKRLNEEWRKEHAND